LLAGETLPQVECNANRQSDGSPLFKEEGPGGDFSGHVNPTPCLRPDAHLGCDRVSGATHLPGIKTASVNPR
jgi:hypothetical protein